jgi:TRAP-type C4-dicarboxylate transport system permease large subunit
MTPCFHDFKLFRGYALLEEAGITTERLITSGWRCSYWNCVGTTSAAGPTSLLHPPWSLLVVFFGVNVNDAITKLYDIILLVNGTVHY